MSKLFIEFYSEIVYAQSMNELPEIKVNVNELSNQFEKVVSKFETKDEEKLYKETFEELQLLILPKYIDNHRIDSEIYVDNLRKIIVETILK